MNQKWNERCEYLRNAIRHMEKNHMAFCYEENGAMLTIGSCKQELNEILNA